MTAMGGGLLGDDLLGGDPPEDDGGYGGASAGHGHVSGALSVERTFAGTSHGSSTGQLNPGFLLMAGTSASHATGSASLSVSTGSSVSMAATSHGTASASAVLTKQAGVPPSAGAFSAQPPYSAPNRVSAFTLTDTPLLFA